MVQSIKIHLISVFIILFSSLLLDSCKDISFNNPLDPNASKEVLKVLNVFDTFLAGEGDIAFDGEKLWKMDTYGTISAFDRDSGVIIRSFSAISGTGICEFDNALYLCSGTNENMLHILDPLSGDIVNRLSTTGIQPGFITADQNELIIYDIRSAGIFRFNPDTGLSQRLFEIPGIRVGGIGIMSGTLLITDINTDTLYRFTMTGGLMNVLSSPEPGITGVDVDNSNNIYIAITNGKVYKVSIP